MKRYIVEIQNIEDFDDIIMQSQWFDSQEEAQKWFDDLEFINEEFVTASIMESEFDEDDCYGDIDMTKMLLGE